MRVLVLGGTGSIGSAVLRELAARGHEVCALARSDASAEKAALLGAAAVIRGNIETPEGWVTRIPEVDGAIHMACDFSSPMATVDRRLLDVLFPHLASRGTRPRFIYTGGCWLFGPTGNVVATERTPPSPLPAFAWMLPHAHKVLESEEIAGVVVHPGMVYGSSAGGVFRRFARDAVERPAIRVVGSPAVRWPLVHWDDLAVLYALALERASPGESYLGVSVDGLSVGRIAQAFARRYGTPDAEPEVITPDTIALELGAWAQGYALDQQLSGAKARRELGWEPAHLDPEGEIAGLA